MTLTDTKIGASYYIKKITLEENVKRRLQMLGMTDATQITILNRKRGGALILKVRGARFAIGRDIGAGIEVGGESRE